MSDKSRSTRRVTESTPILGGDSLKATTSNIGLGISTSNGLIGQANVEVSGVVRRIASIPDEPSTPTPTRRRPNR